MSDNRVISKSKYTVTGVTRTTTDNYITKRPYNTTPDSHSKRQNTSDSFNKPLKSTVSDNPSNDDSTTFLNELDNKLRLQSEENLRLVQSKFNNNALKHSNSKESIAETQLHNKLSEAMEVEVDVSTMYKKVKLLNDLKNKS